MVAVEYAGMTKSEVDQLREDNKLLAMYFTGALPDENTQTDAEQEATMAAIDAAVKRALA